MRRGPAQSGREGLEMYAVEILNDDGSVELVGLYSSRDSAEAWARAYRDECGWDARVYPA